MATPQPSSITSAAGCRVDLSGQVALVTGASRGIGRAIATRLAACGATVAGVARSMEALEGTLAAIREAGGTAEGFAADVAQAADVERVVSEIEAKFGAIHVLVNNAGITRDGLMLRMEESAWDEVVDTNLKGTFLTCKTFLPAMIAAGSGCIVNVGSTAGIRGGHTRAAYCAAKAGVVNLTRSLALDHGGDGVRICCVCPGLVDTPMADWITSRPDALREFEESVPARRIGTVGDIAGAVSFLASNAASYAHGTVLVVDGGVTA